MDATMETITSTEDYPFYVALPTDAPPLVQLSDTSTEIQQDELNMTIATAVNLHNASAAKSSRRVFDQQRQIIFLSVMFVSITVANSSVLLAIGYSKRGFRSRMNFFISNLAISDLLVALFNIFIDLVWRITIEWHAGSVFCKIAKFLQTSVTYASTYVLVALSIDRLDAIARPMSFSGSGKRAKILIATAWLFSCLFSFPNFFLNNASFKPSKGYVQCSFIFTEDWQWKTYFTLVTVIVFILPAVIIACCYFVIIYVIWTKSQVLLPHKKASLSAKLTSLRSGDTKVSATNSNAAISGSSSLGVIPKAKIRTVKMTLVIVIAFVVCWSPFFIFNLLQVYRTVPINVPNISVFIQSLSTFNSLANPLIYGMFSSNLFCKKLNCCRIFWKRLTCVSFGRRRALERGPSVGNSTSMTTYASVAPDESGRGPLRFNRTLARRQSGPPCVREHLTAEESSILQNLCQYSANTEQAVGQNL